MKINHGPNRVRSRLKHYKLKKMTGFAVKIWQRYQNGSLGWAHLKPFVVFLFKMDSYISLYIFNIVLNM